MVARALYLWKAIEHYTAEDEDLQMFALTKTEWDQVAVVCTILLPFKLASQRLQATKRPGIDSVFWDYESLFNKIDAIKEDTNSTCLCRQGMDSRAASWSRSSISQASKVLLKDRDAICLSRCLHLGINKQTDPVQTRQIWRWISRTVGGKIQKELSRVICQGLRIAQLLSVSAHSQMSVLWGL